ncbi:leucine-rich repeat domain-containing protein [Ruminococcus albus]|uniref:leucine-rich repeat domain-containing protein n=1 Tax=Ruminococcus albus TaxID=1264 RepID=UPI000466CD9F|nr:leucine-rich repeat domain-containing protein [Ruminococcus albus]
MKKKLLALLCVGAVLSTNIGTSSLIFADWTGEVITASAANYQPVQNDEYMYLSLDDDTVLLCRYLGDDTEVNVPSEIDGKTVTIIGSSCFSSKSLMTSVTIPDTITSIESSAFSSCYELTSVNIPDSVTTIGSYAFRDCRKLSAVTIPENITSIGIEVFAGCTSFNDINVSENNPAYSSFDGVLYTRDMKTLLSCPSRKTSVTIYSGVTKIADSAFMKCEYLSSVDLPDGITSIGDKAFAYCNSLKSITIPKTVTSIKRHLFEESYSLKEIKVADGNTTFASYDGALYTKDMKTILECPGGKTSIKFHNDTTAIGNYAFFYCKRLTSVSIPKTVTCIGDYSFNHCLNLTSATLHDNITYLGKYAFSDCIRLSSVHIPKSITTLNDYVFHACGFTSVSIPDNITVIGDGAFMRCYKLYDIDIPKTVTSIGRFAFTNTKWEKDRQAEDPFIIVNGILIDATTCSGDVVIPSGVSIINGTAFYYANGITSVTIPTGVKTIIDNEFTYCTNLKYVVIPTSVTNIGYCLFPGCTDPDFKILCNKGSAAEKYAVDNKIAYELIDTFPTNIKVEYSEKYHQVRFTWDKVRGADKYCLAVYQAGKWKVQTQNITDTVYTSPKNLTQGMTYKVAISARVNGKWDTANAIKNAVTIVKIPYASVDTDGDGIINAKDSQPNQKNNYPSVLVDYINKGIVDMNYTEETVDDFVICKTPLSEILLSCNVNSLTDDGGVDHAVDGNYDDWYIMALNRNGTATYGLYKMREQEYDPDDDDHDNNVPGVTISFVEFDISKLNDVIYHNTSDTSDLYNEIQKVVQVPDAPYSPELQSYFANVNSEAPYLIAEAYVDKIANSYSISSIPFPQKLNEIYTNIAIINAEIIVAMINSRKDVPILLAKKAELNKVPNALTDCNKNFGSIIADENTGTIQITSSSNLDYNEKRAILSAYTADTSFNMFAAEVQFHAEYLDDGLISDLVYSHVIHADMTIDQSTTDYLTDTYHNPNDSRVVAQANAHVKY